MKQKLINTFIVLVIVGTIGSIVYGMVLGSNRTTQQIEDQIKNPIHNEGSITRVTHYKYKEHEYISFAFPNIIHNPDCKKCSEIKK